MTLTISSKRLLPLVISIFLVLSCTFALVSLINKELPSNQSSPALKVIDKIKKAEKLGKTVELSEDEVNAIVKFYLAKTLASQHYIKDVNIKLHNNFIEFLVPASYLNKVDVIVSSKGSLSCTDDSIIYKPQGFWAGNVPLSKNIIAFFAGKITVKGMSIQQGNLIFAKELIPFSINKLIIHEEKMIVSFIP